MVEGLYAFKVVAAKIFAAVLYYYQRYSLEQFSWFEYADVLLVFLQFVLSQLNRFPLSHIFFYFLRYPE